MTNYFYIHIPFCNQKCPYCKFALTPIFDEFKKKRYIEYLKKEIREYFESGKIVSLEGLGKETVGVSGKQKKGGAKLPSFSSSNAFDTFGNKSMENSIGNVREEYTIYFGGGTPSILSHREIREILDCFPFYTKNKTEITLESNPEDITQEYVEGLIELGVNRLSMGIQTLNEKSLTEIHRSDRKSIFNALENIGNALSAKGNISVNIDFILGLPYTLKGEIISSIMELHKKYNFITHTSVYMLEDEDYPKHWKENSISEIDIQDEFTAILEYFDQAKWNHYELSNFAKPGYESIHNRGYWNHSNSRGFGLSSASYEDMKRWNNASSFSGYYEGKIENEEILDSKAIQIENMMFGLRTSGWKIEGTILEKGRTKIQILKEQNLITLENNHIKLTKTGIFLIDHIMGELLDV